MKILTTFVVFTVFTLLTCAARPASPSQKGLAQKNLAAGKAFMAENRKKEGVIELPNGVQYRVINAGSGPKPKATDTVSVHYRGTLIDGSEFESSVRTGKPAAFRLDSVIKGLQEALPNMSQGSKWQIVIPPELGYGEQGAGGKIGPNETMVFDIELVGIGTNTSLSSVVSVSDPTFQSCKFHLDTASEPILANENLCILVYKQTSSLKGHVFVSLIGPSTIDERNRWINEVGEWLKTKGLDACADKTVYMVDPYSPVKPPLAKQVGGIPGEKAFYMLGGLDKPISCPQPCSWGSYRLDRRGRCSDAP